MRFCINSENERVDILDASKEKEYRCEYCNNICIPAQGNINEWYFKHKDLSQCDDWFDSKNSMSKWHIDWQNKFPKRFQEVILNNHRADVKIDNLIIEFQHSSLSIEKFNQRNDFYSQFGKLIWLFDFRDKEIKKQLELNPKYNIYLWKHASKSISFNYWIKGIEIYFQIEDDLIIKPDPNNESWKYFRVNKTNIFSKELFLMKLREKYKIYNQDWKLKIKKELEKYNSYVEVAIKFGEKLLMNKITLKTTLERVLKTFYIYKCDVDFIKDRLKQINMEIKNNKFSNNVFKDCSKNLLEMRSECYKDYGNENIIKLREVFGDKLEIIE